MKDDRSNLKVMPGETGFIVMEDRPEFSHSMWQRFWAFETAGAVAAFILKRLSDPKKGDAA